MNVKIHSPYTAHKATFTKREKENNTELSKHIWKLKDQNIPFETTWRILKHAQPYTPSTKRCNLCTWEKYYITATEKDNILNSRSELISTCRHRRNFLLSEYGWHSNIPYFDSPNREAIHLNSLNPPLTT